jgi:hypothetical protein
MLEPMRMDRSVRSYPTGLRIQGKLTTTAIAVAAVRSRPDSCNLLLQERVAQKKNAEY